MFCELTWGDHGKVTQTPADCARQSALIAIWMRALLPRRVLCAHHMKSIMYLLHSGFIACHSPKVQPYVMWHSIWRTWIVIFWLSCFPGNMLSSVCKRFYSQQSTKLCLNEIRKQLIEFEGGAVTLSSADQQSDIRLISISHPQRKNAFTGVHCKSHRFSSISRPTKAIFKF
mgnify:CR=1 FL=1